MGQQCRIKERERKEQGTRPLLEGQTSCIHLHENLTSLNLRPQSTHQANCEGSSRAYVVQQPQLFFTDLVVQISLRKKSFIWTKESTHIKRSSRPLASAHILPTPPRQQPTKTHRSLQYLSPAPCPPFLSAFFLGENRRRDKIRTLQTRCRLFYEGTCSSYVLLEYDSSEQFEPWVYFNRK